MGMSSAIALGSSMIRATSRLRVGTMLRKGRQSTDARCDPYHRERLSMRKMERHRINHQTVILWGDYKEIKEQSLKGQKSGI